MAQNEHHLKHFAGLKCNDVWSLPAGLRRGDRDAQQSLANRLHAINVEAWHQRYPSEKRGTAEPCRFEFQIHMTDYQVLKDLDCLLYQCSEGTVPESDLFKRTEALAGGMAVELIRRTPQYNDATWGR